jgi:hypothetical protein
VVEGGAEDGVEEKEGQHVDAEQLGPGEEELKVDAIVSHAST